MSIIFYNMNNLLMYWFFLKYWKYSRFLISFLLKFILLAMLQPKLTKIKTIIKHIAKGYITAEIGKWYSENTTINIIQNSRYKSINLLWYLIYDKKSFIYPPILLYNQHRILSYNFPMTASSTANKGNCIHRIYNSLDCAKT